jgi:hypothetical protein
MRVKTRYPTPIFVIPEFCETKYPVSRLNASSNEMPAHRPA